MTTLARLYKGASVLRAIAVARLAGITGGTDAPVFLDVGARGGLSPRWDLVARSGLISPVFVEADHVEASRLALRHPRARLIATAVGAVDNAELQLHLTREPGRSSLLRPDVERLREFGDLESWEILEQRPLTVRRLDRVWPDGCPTPTYVKIDVQGFELQVIEGMGALLDSVQCIELEAMLAPAYIGQPTLTQVAECLMTHGFDLVRLASMGLYGGRAMLEFNAFWVRRESHQDPQVKFWKAVNGVGSVHRAVVWGY